MGTNIVVRVAENLGTHPLFLKVYSVATLSGLLLLAITLGWIYGFQGGMDWNSSKEPQFNIHIFLMTLGFLVLQCHGAVVYRFAASFPKWNLKLVHAGIMLFSILLCSIGIYVSFDNHKKNNYPDLASVHSWIGLLTFTIYIFQWLLGFAAFLLPWTPGKFYSPTSTKSHHHHSTKDDNTIDAFVPPKPKEFVNAIRLFLPASSSNTLSHFCASFGTKFSSPSHGDVRLMVGGKTPVWHANKAAMASTIPAAPSKCPIAPLMDDTARD
ncbi:unnamed protein product [Notodromas monacha]|uniref:Cytochrome b561 domain-containing protein n=1 Tax=Notodromas monacha TaxID=399045 RepID=A0A7R9BMD5_9CRUS|nr:unnamed protein product [Notodromas monacha]CAG0918162.1 unnamed protein product [Notodromas monacha]